MRVLLASAVVSMLWIGANLSAASEQQVSNGLELLRKCETRTDQKIGDLYFRAISVCPEMVGVVDGDIKAHFKEFSKKLGIDAGHIIYYLGSEDVRNVSGLAEDLGEDVQGVGFAAFPDEVKGRRERHTESDEYQPDDFDEWVEKAVTVLDKGTRYHISARELERFYEENEVNADHLFGGQIIAIRGKVREIGLDIAKTPYVVLDPDQFGFGGVRVRLSRDDPGVRDLKKGQQIDVVGIPHSYMMKQVQVRGEVLVSPNRKK